MKLGKFLTGMAAGTIAGAALGMIVTPKSKGLRMRANKKWLRKNRIWDW